jgi:hypothetical protein
MKVRKSCQLVQAIAETSSTSIAKDRAEKGAISIIKSSPSRRIIRIELLMKVSREQDCESILSTDF